MPMNNGRSTDNTMRNAVTVGWDSIESSVDAFELKPKVDDLAPLEWDDIIPAPKPKSYDDFDALNDIRSMLARARRDRNDLARLTAAYGIDPVASDKALRTHRQRGSREHRLPDRRTFPYRHTQSQHPRLTLSRPSTLARSERGQTPALLCGHPGATPWTTT